TWNPRASLLLSCAAQERRGGKRSELMSRLSSHFAPQKGNRIRETSKNTRHSMYSECSFRIHFRACAPNDSLMLRIF
ncbi:MAG: hypothetical protein IIV08_03955, partial [Selenomonadales bacterium]|nr:hypothetical protein [Selenomonadales bacterium]